MSRPPVSVMARVVVGHKLAHPYIKQTIPVSSGKWCSTFIRRQCATFGTYRLRISAKQCQERKESGQETEKSKHWSKKTITSGLQQGLNLVQLIPTAVIINKKQLKGHTQAQVPVMTSKWAPKMYGFGCSGQWMGVVTRIGR